MMTKIQNLISVSDVSGVKVVENGEKLVSLNGVRPDLLVVFSKAYKEGKACSIEQVLVREEVKHLLIQAAESLPKGYKLVVWETYTPRALQESLRKVKLDDISMLPHMTGAGIDVSLADEKGNVLDMGTDLSDDAPQNKETLHFEEKEELTEQEQTYRERRRMLFLAMSEAGFTNNPTKWFHWDYGNRWWAKVNSTEAFYGGIDV